MLGVGVGVLLLLAVFVLLGAVVQGVVGIGLGLVAAPVTAMVAPELMPGTMLLLVSAYPVLTLAREHGDVDWGGIGWALPTRVVGTGLGVALVALVDERQLGIAVGLMVLLAVGLTVRAVTIPVTRGTLAAAGLVSGVAGTTTSIGGPPFAILLQHRPARQLRTTLAVYFLVGSAISLVALAVAGQLRSEQLLAALVLAPALLLGTALTAVLGPRLRPALVRPLVLVVCAGSAAVLLVRSIA